MPLNEKANNIVFTNINMCCHILSAIDIKKLDEYVMYLNSFWLSECHDTVLRIIEYTRNPTGFSTFQTVNSLMNNFLCARHH